MNQPEKKQDLFDNPRFLSLAFGGFNIICILLLLFDFILHRHVTHEWESFTGFYALFGFIAYVTIVLAATLLRKFVQRKEDYYDVDR
ncbi:MAG: hypothetical protein JSW45_07425 [Thiotrichales bacterium]|nr:MAG: hypothetical protein JSW45_07425 [Thiotrichales bacterium]